MILERLILTNVFSYRGKVEFELRPPGDGRNILLIFGRNGQGKTSFLNSLKLLVGGVTEELRSTAVFGRVLGPHQYVMKQGDEWQGIFNTRALREGDLTASVEGWFSHAGRKLRVRRSWTKNNSQQGYDDTHEIVFEDLASEEQQKASEFLATQFPRDYIPFYLFDGELIQRLAEDQGKEQVKAMHAILELAPLQKLAEELTTLQKDLRNNDESPALESALFEVQGERHKLKGTIRAERARQEAARASLGLLEKEVDRDVEARDQLLTRGSERRGQDIAQSIRALRGELEGLEKGVLDAFDSAPTAYATALRKLALERLGALEKHNYDGVQAANELLDFLAKEVPGRLFDHYGAPRLDTNIKEYYRDRLRKELDAARPGVVPGSLQILATDRGRLTQQIEALDAKPVSVRVQPLLQLAQRRQELKALITEHELLGDYRDDERQQIDELKQKIARDQKNMGALRDSLELGEKELVRHQNRDTELSKQEQQLEVQLEALARDSGKRRQLMTMSSATDALLKLALKSRRAQLEEAINRHLRELLDSNHAIQHVAVKDNFSILLQGTGGSTVARGSISAGMKQLTAVALLWALNEISRREIFVAIDTPLARLDRAHQEHVLTRYLPRTAPQVIVLPTDSELDEKKYALVKPFVYKELVLRNVDGDSTKVEQRSLYG